MHQNYVENNHECFYAKIWKEAVQTRLKISPWQLFGEKKENNRKISQDIWWVGQELNQVPPKYKCLTLQLHHPGSSLRANSGNTVKGQLFRPIKSYVQKIYNT